MQIHDFLLQRDVKWPFTNLPVRIRAEFGKGAIMTMRNVLNAIMKEQVLDDESIGTLMCKVKAIINGRPSTKPSDDPRDMEPLTSNNFLLLTIGPQFHPLFFPRKTHTIDDGVRCSIWLIFFGVVG